LPDNNNHDHKHIDNFGLEEIPILNCFTVLGTCSSNCLRNPRNCDVVSLHAYQYLHRNWIEDELQLEPSRTGAHWAQSIAVGSKSFIEQFCKALGVKGKHRDFIEDGGSYCIKDGCSPSMSLFLDGFSNVPARFL
jgi:hypothetical protein